MSAESATLRLENQKNGWKGVCIHQHTNGDAYLCPVRALGRRVLHIRSNGGAEKTFLSAYFEKGRRVDVTDNNIRDCVKWAALWLDYPASRGTDVEEIHMHLLRSGGANALALSGYS